MLFTHDEITLVSLMISIFECSAQCNRERMNTVPRNLFTLPKTNNRSHISIISYVSVTVIQLIYSV